MKKILVAVALFLAVGNVKSQQKTTDNTSTTGKRDLKKSAIDLSNRANDHFMVQLGYENWSGANIVYGPKGFSRYFNVYFMLDKPSKSNPHISLGYGIGLSTNNYFFNDVFIDIKSNNTTMPFSDTKNSSDNKFKKFKLATDYLEIPLELRYADNVEEPNKGFKASLGLKLGLLLKAYTKGKNQINENGASLYGSGYIVKEQDKHYFNTTKAAVTGRVGIGFISLDGSYQLTSLLKSSAGPTINPWSIGITLSGL
ncbi:outer membrane beta-barrel protein [Deminuibacter soli]|nr:outer membrane beta-barrel protein [Deminuibacter soli]